MNHEIILTENMTKSIDEYQKEKNNENQCLRCKVIGKNINTYYYEKNEIKRFYNCCNRCRREIAFEFLEKEIIKNYEDFLNYGLNMDDVNEYYYNLSYKYIMDRFERVTEVLNEIYEDENNPSCYILK